MILPRGAERSRGSRCERRVVLLDDDAAAERVSRVYYPAFALGDISIASTDRARITLRRYFFFPPPPSSCRARSGKRSNSDSRHENLIRSFRRPTAAAESGRRPFDRRPNCRLRFTVALFCRVRLGKHKRRDRFRAVDYAFETPAS